MPKLPSSPCQWKGTNPMQRIYAALGVDPKSRVVPKTLHGEWTVDGWRVVVKRSAPKSYHSGKPRIFVRHDGRLVPAGRVRQALCALDVHKARRRAKRTGRDADGRFRNRRW